MHRLEKIYRILTIFWLLYTPPSLMRGTLRKDPVFFGLSALMTLLGFLELAQELFRKRKNDGGSDEGEPEL